MADPFSPVTAVVTGQMNAKNAREEQQRQHRYNKELMQLSYGYGQQEQLNAAKNTRAGLIAAGINPAVQDGGTFAPASGPSALASTPSPNRYPNFESGLAGLLQLDNIKAQTENIKAQTESVKIENQNKEDANATAALNLSNYFRVKKEECEKNGDSAGAEFYKRMEGECGSVGALQSLHNFLKMADDQQLMDLHKSTYNLERKVADEQLAKGIWLDLVKAPRTERLQMVKFIRKMEYEIENLHADTQGKFMDIQLTDAQKEQIKLISKHYQNSDLATMVAEGRWKDAAKYIFVNALGAGAERAAENVSEVGKAVVTKKVPSTTILKK